MSSPKGLPCPVCRHTRSEVTDSRVEPFGGIASMRRWRRCEGCGHRWKTYELSVAATTELRRAIATLKQIRKTLAAHERGGAGEEPEP